MSIVEYEVAAMDAEYLREILHYDPETGIFRWKIRPSNNVNVGDETGQICTGGHVQIRIQRRLYMAHRLAWLYVHGKLPSDQIDHIDMNKRNNRITNLREATCGENCQNRPIRMDNNSGFVGVGWDKKSQKWRARITINRKLRALGYFDSKEDAFSAYKIAKERLHEFQPTVPS